MKTHPVFTIIVAIGFIAIFLALKVVNLNPEKNAIYEPDHDYKKEKPEIWQLEMEGMNNPTLYYANHQLCADMLLPVPGPRRELATYCIQSDGVEFESGTWNAKNDSLMYHKYIQPVKDSVRSIARNRGYLDERDWRW